MTTELYENEWLFAEKILLKKAKLEEENKQLKEVINKARNNIIKDIEMIKKQYVEKPEIIIRLEQTIKILGEKNE